MDIIISAEPKIYFKNFMRGKFTRKDFLINPLKENDGNIFT